jgi:tRNA(fMet)-specific endonuclease VapC
MLFALDTDHLSILQRKQQPECDHLASRLKKLQNDSVCTSIVNFQEQALGWAAYLNRARTPVAILKAYRELWLIERYYRLHNTPIRCGGSSSVRSISPNPNSNPDT